MPLALEELLELRRQYEEDRPKYAAYADALRVVTLGLCRNAGLPVDSVICRAKEVASFVDKLSQRGYESADQVVDKAGVRIVTRYKSTIPRVAERLQREFEVIESSEHGVNDVTSFGYAGQHLIVRLSGSRSCLLEWEEFETMTAEIQVRSVLQHAWAGISHSLDYKSESETPLEARRRLHRVAALLEQGDEEFDRFREEVEQARAMYREAAEVGTWTSLPLDVDALELVWNRLGWIDAERIALGAGWRKASVPRTYHSTWETPSDIGRARRLIRVSHAAAVSDMAQLHALIAGLSSSTALLTKIAASGGRRGYVPYAIGPDILTLVILSEDGEGATVDAARADPAPLLETLVLTALEVHADLPSADVP